MSFGQTTLLAQLSEAIAGQVAAAAPLLAAIRVGPNRHVTGIVWQRDLVITSDQALPALDSFTLVLSGGILTAGRPARRNATSNLASLRLEAPIHSAQVLPPAEPRVGALALVLGADVDAAPMVRLAVIHKVNGGRGDNADRSLTLDMPASLVAEGGPVLDAAGGLLGMAIIGANNEATVIPHSAMVRLLETSHTPDGRRGWLGVALQPITVPDGMRVRRRAGVRSYGGEPRAGRPRGSGRAAAWRYPALAGWPQCHRRSCAARLPGTRARWTSRRGAADAGRSGDDAADDDRAAANRLIRVIPGDQQDLLRARRLRRAAVRHNFVVGTARWAGA